MKCSTFQVAVALFLTVFWMNKTVKWISIYMTVI